MTDLQARLDFIQDKILDLFEKNSTDLADHLQFYYYGRKEHALLYLARQQGIRLSMPVPSLAASKSRAKDAIEMYLLVESLMKSPYGREEWTLPQVSRERYTAPPVNTFKKGGSHVQVQFGPDADNVTEYTTWEHIYLQDADDEWYKADGGVDLQGLYFIDSAGQTMYYVKFSDEAVKYGTPGNWALLYDNNPVAFVTSPGADSSSSSLPRRARSRSQSSSTSSSSGGHSRLLRRRARSRTSSITRSRSRSSTPGRGRSRRGRTRSRSRSISKRRSGSRSRSRSRSRTRTRGQPTLPAADFERLGYRAREPFSQSPSPPAPHAVSSTSASSPRRSRGGSRSPGVGRLPGPGQLAPDQVGSSRSTVPRGARSRLEQLRLEAADPPGLCLAGAPNKVKCYRFYLKKHHHHRFDYISTTFQWTSSDSTDRVGGGARMVMLFSSEAARRDFIKTVQLPTSIQSYPVSFGGL